MSLWPTGRGLPSSPPPFLPRPNPLYAMQRLGGFGVGGGATGQCHESHVMNYHCGWFTQVRNLLWAGQYDSSTCSGINLGAWTFKSNLRRNPNATIDGYIAEPRIFVLPGAWRARAGSIADSTLLSRSFVLRRRLRRPPPPPSHLQSVLFGTLCLAPPLPSPSLHPPT